ncbi:hypothetical protein AcidC75_27970 [Acidisoma sp. C75]
MSSTIVIASQTMQDNKPYQKAVTLRRWQGQEARGARPPAIFKARAGGHHGLAADAAAPSLPLPGRARGRRRVVSLALHPGCG